MSGFRLSLVVASLLVTVAAHSQNGFSAPLRSSGVTVKMGNPNPKVAAKLKAERAALLKSLNLSDKQKGSWEALEATSRKDRQVILAEQKKSDGKDAMRIVGKLQTIAETERKGKRSLLTESQRAIFDRSPASKNGTFSMKTTSR